MASFTLILWAFLLALTMYNSFLPTGTAAREIPTISSLVSEKTFNKIFPHLRDDSCPSKGFYRYESFINATKRFPEFGTTGSKTIRKREIAAFLAQISHQTAPLELMNSTGPYTWGLWRLEESDEDDLSGGYCADGSIYRRGKCYRLKSYKGRGPMMFRWNFNYGPAGIALGFDSIWYPERLLSSSTLAFETAVWFWMTAHNSIPSCHSVMVGSYKPTPADIEANRISGYGLTTNYIVESSSFYPECGRVDDGRVQNRIGYFKRIASLLKVSTGSNLDCANQRTVHIIPPQPIPPPPSF